MCADRYLPYGKQDIDEEDIAAVVAVLRGAEFLTTGPIVSDFEEAFARRVGAQYAVACSSGTAALHLSALASGLGPGSIAVVPSVTFAATANAIRYVGGRPVFADVNRETGLMEPSDVVRALEREGLSGVDAILPVFLTGQSADPEPMWRTASDLGAVLIEDACHALGSRYFVDDEWQCVGSSKHADASIFSFHPVKTITTGEGGMITTNDKDFAKRAKAFRNHGISRDPIDFVHPSSAGQEQPWYYEVQSLGFNYRITDIQCALGLSQLRKLDGFIRARKQITEWYDQRLKALAPLVRPLGRVEGCDPALHLYVVLIDFTKLGIDRGQLMTMLHDRMIGTQVHYIPLYHHPTFGDGKPSERLDGAEAYYASALSLPLYPGLEETDVDRVVDALKSALGGKIAEG